MARILVVDDEEGVRSFLVDALKREGHDVTAAIDGHEAIALLGKKPFDLVVTDLKMPGVDGHQVLLRARAERRPSEVIVLTAHGSVAGAVEAIKAGAFDYLQKPVESPAALRALVTRALARRTLTETRHPSDASHGAGHDGPAGGGAGGLADDVPLSHGAPSMRPVVEALRRVATTQATVLLLGESGTGKEVAARAIHRGSQRSSGPFIAINCAALSESLLESELFGHEKGAFTGAVERRIGRIEQASGGTFFLDEIGELKAPLQAKLLRVIQERRFERVGGTRTLQADVRWIAATNRDLRTMTEQGEFREDLYHRLAVFPVRLPPLRERREDILPIADVLLSRIAAQLGRPALRISREVQSRVQLAPWTGNVRELSNALERAAILADGDELTEDHHWLDIEETLRHRTSSISKAGERPSSSLDVPRAPSRTEPVAPTATSLASSLTDATGASGSASAGSAGASLPAGTLAQLERESILRALAAFDGNRRKAAEHLGIGLRTLYEKLKRFGITG